MAKQPIKYWETDVPPSRSAAQLVDLLVQYGAQRTSVEWDAAKSPVAVSFVIADPKHGQVPVRLVVRTDDVLAALKKKSIYNVDRKRAERIAWRHAKDLVEQQLLGIYLGQSSLLETFFAHVQIRTEDGAGNLGGWVIAALESGNVPRAESGALMLPPVPKQP